MQPMPPTPVLVVEGDPAIAALFTHVLTGEGYAVTIADNPRAALAVCAARGPDAFALVLAQPVADHGGAAARYAALDRLRAATRAPIVICTRHPAALFADHRAHGCAAVLEEPCDLQDLLDLVAALCRPRGEGEGEGEGAGAHGARGVPVAHGDGRARRGECRVAMT